MSSLQSRVFFSIYYAFKTIFLLISVYNFSDQKSGKNDSNLTWKSTPEVQLNTNSKRFPKTKNYSLLKKWEYSSAFYSFFWKTSVLRKKKLCTNEDTLKKRICIDVKNFQKVLNSYQQKTLFGVHRILLFPNCH